MPPSPSQGHAFPGHALCGVAIDSRGGDEGRKPLAGVDHAGLDRVPRNAENLGTLADRLLLIVDQIDDLGVLARERGERAAERSAGTPLPASLSPEPGYGAL